MSIYVFLLCCCALNLVQISGSELKVAFNCCTKEIPRREDFIIIIIYNNFACYAILRASVPKTLRSAFNNKNITTRTLTRQNISWKLVETYNTMDVAYELMCRYATHMTKLTTRMLYRGRTTLGFNCHIAEINSAKNKYLSS